MEAKWSPKGAKWSQKGGPKIDAFLILNMISPEPSDLPFGSLREGNLLRRKPKKNKK